MGFLASSDVFSSSASLLAAFNDTMIKIWQEQITLLGVIDTGQLLRSPVGVRATADGKVSEVHLSQAFLEYGLWQDYGTGKEVPRGNSGDLGKPKVRKARHWFSRKYYMSVMNIKEFMADSLGIQFIGIVAEALSKKRFSWNNAKA
jgi:hypothetical protein